MKVSEEEVIPVVASATTHPSHIRADWIGTLIGLLVFAFGISLLVITFNSARTLFDTPPATQISIVAGKPIDLGQAGNSFAHTLFQVVFLVVMAVIGSMISNRGISLYCGARARGANAK